MDTKRQWFLITALVSVAILVAGFMFLVKPEHKKASKLQTQTDQIVSQTRQLRTQLASLQDEQRNLPAEQAKLKKVTDLLPAQASLPTLTRQLDAVAAAAKVDLTNIAPGTAAPLASTTAATTTTSAVAPTSGTPSLEALPLVLTVSGTYYQIESFIGGLEALTRAMLVDTFTVAPGAAADSSSTAVATPGTGELTVTLNTRVFMTTAPLPGATTSTTAQ